MSLNFSGQLKKRTVNLGGGFKGNRASLLTQTHKEREKREQERLKEKKVLLIQRRITRYLDLFRFKYTQSQNWNTIVQLRQFRDANEVVFLFSSFYSFIFNQNQSKIDQIQIILSILTGHNLEEIRPTNFLRLYKCAAESLIHLNMNIETNLPVIPYLLELLMLVHSHIQYTQVDVIPTLSDIFELTFSFQYNTKEILQVINMYSHFEVINYIKFLAKPVIASLPSFQINFASLAKDSKPFDTSSLTTEEKIQLLSNVIEKSGPFTEDFLTSVAFIASSIQESLVTKSEKSFNEDNDSSDGNYHNHPQKVISEKLNDSIKVLYTREFIASASKTIKNSHISALLYGSLINLKPSLKSSFMIYSIPNTFGPLLESVLNNYYFKLILNTDEDRFFSIPASLLEDVFSKGTQFLYYDLLIFLELYQYRLITSNDTELFTNYGLDDVKFVKIAIFLKKLVFNLIWNHFRIIGVAERPKIEQLKDIAIKLLSQVYLKDTRLGIFAKSKNSWLLNQQRLDLANFTNFLVRYEEKKNDDSYASDDEEAIISSQNHETQAKLEIFNKAPFFFSFEKRVEIFQTLVRADRERLGLSLQARSMFFSPFVENRQSAIIRREHLLEDAYTSFNKLGETFKSKLAIIFVNEHGRESGIDGGGITKEFLTSVVHEGFGDLFVENSYNELYPNPEIGLKYQYRVDTEAQLEKLNYIKFLGKIIGKCLYERVLVDISFARFFLTKFNSGYKNSFDDLKSLDFDLYMSLNKVLTMSETELESLGLTFSVDERLDKKNITVDLIQDGSITPVNTSNRLKFIHELSNYKMNKMINLQCNYFLSGLYEIVSREWLSMFNPHELHLLISGDTRVDIQDLKKHTVYANYDPESTYVRNFWEVVEEFNNKEKSQLIKFVTSVPRAPLLGFKALSPNFAVRNDGWGDTGRLPTSSTCVNLLNLPQYSDKETLKKKLLYAINAEARFDLQ